MKLNIEVVDPDHSQERETPKAGMTHAHAEDCQQTLQNVNACIDLMTAEDVQGGQNKEQRVIQ